MGNTAAMRQAWKREERWYAEKLGGKRVPITGRQRGDVPDVAHPIWSIEVKSGRTALSAKTIKTAFEQAGAAARGGRIPLVCLSWSEAFGKPIQRFVMLHAEDFIALVGEE